MVLIKKILFLVVVVGLTGCSTPKLSFHVHGAAQPDRPSLVFVHGWMSNQTLWQNQVDHFKDTFQVITLDLAGHGQSAARRDEYSVAAFGRDVADVVNKVGPQKVVLVGHSMGGPVVLEAAELLDDKVVGIVGVDTFYTPFQYPTDDAGIEQFVRPIREDFLTNVLKMVQGMFGPHASQNLKDTVSDGIKKADPKIGVNALEHLFKWQIKRREELLAKHQGKLLNLNGAPQGKLTATHPSVVMIKGAAHFPAQTQAAAFNQALAAYLSRLQ